MDSQPAAAGLLAEDEPLPFELLEHAGDRPIIIVCDHASNRIPRALGTLGLEPGDLFEHIALDIGAAAVARSLAARFGASLILGTYSRLVVDLNRSLEDVTAFPEIVDGVRIPGNANLDRSARAERARAIHKPYHEAVRALCHRKMRGSTAPVFVSIHSFTPRMSGIERPWHLGVLWDKDPRLPLPLMERLRAEPGLLIGNNEPYSGKHPDDYTIDHHAERLGLAHAGIELRQDLILDQASQEEWARRLGDALAPLLEDESLYRLRRTSDAEARP